MKRAKFFVCCGIVCLTWQIVVAQQPTNPMPVAATGIIAQMDKEILSSKKKAVDALEKVLKDTTKKGDLAGAMAVKQTLDQLNSEIGALAANRSGRGAGGIVGRWRDKEHGYDVEYFPDGTVTCSSGGLKGTWVMNGASVETTFSGGIRHTMERATDGWAGFQRQGEKAPIAIRYTRAP